MVVKNIFEKIINAYSRKKNLISRLANIHKNTLEKILDEVNLKL